MWTIQLAFRELQTKTLACASTGRLPTNTSAHSNKAFKALADPEFQEHSTELIKSVRECFEFKRSDLSMQPGTGEATIKTALFSISTHIELGSDAKHYRIITELYLPDLTSFRDFPAFSKFLGINIKKVTLHYNKAHPIDITIDKLEAILPAKAINYPLDLSYIKVQTEDVPFIVTFEPQSFCLESPSNGSNNWAAYTKAIDALSGALPTV